MSVLVDASERKLKPPPCATILGLLAAGGLLAVWAVGTGANWVADIASGRDWQSNPMNTTFQRLGLLALLNTLHPTLQDVLSRTDLPGTFHQVSS